MEHSSFTLILILFIMVVVAAAVWLASRMVIPPTMVGDVPFDEGDFASIEVIIECVSLEKWHDRIYDYIWRAKLLTELEKREKTDVLKDLLWYLHTCDMLKKLIHGLRDASRDKRPKMEEFPKYIDRLNARQIVALRHWITKEVRLKQADAEFLFELLRKKDGGDDNQGGGESGGTPSGGPDAIGPRGISPGNDFSSGRGSSSEGRQS